MKDVRHEYRALLDEALLDDGKVVFKDRSSTAADGGAIVGNIDITGDVSIGDDLTVTGDASVGTKLTIPNQSEANISVGMNTLDALHDPAGVPLKIQNNSTSQSLASGGFGHIAHMWGDAARFSVVEPITGIINIHNWDSANSTYFGDMLFGRSNGGGGFGEYIAFSGTTGNVSIGRSHPSDTGSFSIALTDIQDGVERLAIDRSLLIEHWNHHEFGIRWRRSGYSKTSLEMKPIDTKS